MKRKDIKTKLKEYFLTHPQAKLRVREIERELQLPLPSVIRYSKELEKEGILLQWRFGKVTAYAADVSPTYSLEKKLFNLRNLHNSGLLQFLEQHYSKPTIVLFGSFDKGENIEDSDIDLYIETPSTKDADLAKFEKQLGHKIQIFRYPSLKKIPNKELANSIINGTTLLGFLEVF